MPILGTTLSKPSLRMCVVVAVEMRGRCNPVITGPCRIRREIIIHGKVEYTPNCNLRFKRKGGWQLVDGYRLPLTISGENKGNGKISVQVYMYYIINSIDI